MKTYRAILGIVLALFLLAATEPQTKPAGLEDPTQFKPLKYRSIGPAWGGRVTRAAGVPGDPNTFYLAAAAGGVWKSTNGGLDWKPIFDSQPISSIGSLAIAPSDQNVIYVGSGEANIRGNVAGGNGIYKSTDAGKTWNHVWKQEGQIGTMVVHPGNPDIAYAAVLGHAFGPNPERGIYRTMDGGKTWQQVLKKDSDTGASDIALDRNNPRILFAGLWQARRQPWSMMSGGPGSGLYMSADSGDTWKQLKGNGLPEGVWGKVGVAVAPSDSRRVYALIEAEKGGLFRSDDGGENWRYVSGNRLIRQRAWYYTTLTVNPTNPNEIWCPQVPMLKSIDGGDTFTFVKDIPHGDNHDLWIDPVNPRRIIGADDGGVNISVDGGETWFAPPLPISQFYHVSADSRVPFYVAGAMQDIGTAQGPSNSLSKGIRNSDWYGVGGGEAGWVVSDSSDPNIVYAGEYSGYISRYDHRTRQSHNVTAYPADGSGHGAEDLKYRFQWTAPIAISPHNPKVVYHGSNVLFRTDNGGQSWTAISPDLTRNDKTKQKWSGGPITGDNTGVEVYDTIFVIAESPLQKDLIWVGTDDGLVQLTKDGGQIWKNVTSRISGLPEWGTVTMVEPSHFDAGTAYVVVDAHRLDDEKPYLFRTTDFGESWSRLSGNLTDDIYLHVVREDTLLKNILYLGTERGVVFSNDTGKTWQALKLNMPTVAVHDLAVKDNSLVVGTKGRSLWIFDHLGLLREWRTEIAETAFHLYSSPDAIRWNTKGTWPEDKWNGENPGGNGVVYYWLKEQPKTDIRLEVLDSSNKVIRTLSSKPEPPTGTGDNIKEEEEGLKKAAMPKDAGIHAYYWDLKYSGAEIIPNAKIDTGDPQFGPVMIPGTYTLRLEVDGKTETTPLRILPDPRTQMTDAEYKQQLDFGLQVRDDVTRLTKDVLQLRRIRDQLQARNKLLEGNTAAAEIVETSTRMLGMLEVLEQKMHNPKAEVNYDILAFQGGAKLYSQLAALYDAAVSGDLVPTGGMKDRYAELKPELEAYEAELKKLVTEDLATLNDSARKLDLPIILGQ